MDRVLILEDDRFIRQLMADTLRSRRYGVFEAGDSRAAEEFLGQEEISVALLDVVLPGETGLEFLPRLKNISPSTLCVIVTAFPSTDIAIQALRLGAFDFIKKPFEPEELLHTVGKAVQFRKVNSEKDALAKVLEAKLGDFQSENGRLAEELRLIHSAVDSVQYGVIFFGEEWSPVFVNRYAKAWLPGVGTEEFGSMVSYLSERGSVSGNGLEFCNTLERFYVVRLSPWEDSGKRVGTVAVFADHTALLEFDELKSALAAISAEKVRGRFAAVAGGSEPSGGQGAGDRAGDDEARSLILLEDMLTMLELGATGMRMDISPFKPGEMIGEVVAQFSSVAATLGLRTRAHCPGDLPTEVLLDARKTRWILRHLATDSVLNLKPGGEIIFSVNSYPPERLGDTLERLISASHFVPAGWLAFKFEDDGSGPGEIFLESLARSFSLDPKTGRFGAGERELGLRVCRNIAATMGARIEVGENETGGGYSALITPYFKGD